MSPWSIARDAGGVAVTFDALSSDGGLYRRAPVTLRVAAGRLLLDGAPVTVLGDDALAGWGPPVDGPAVVVGDATQAVAIPRAAWAAAGRALEAAGDL